MTIVVGEAGDSHGRSRRLRVCGMPVDNPRALARTSQSSTRNCPRQAIAVSVPGPSSSSAPSSSSRSSRIHAQATLHKMSLRQYFDSRAARMVDVQCLRVNYVRRLSRLQYPRAVSYGVTRTMGRSSVGVAASCSESGSHSLMLRQTFVTGKNCIYALACINRTVVLPETAKVLIAVDAVQSRPLRAISRSSGKLVAGVWANSASSTTSHCSSSSFVSSSPTVSATVVAAAFALLVIAAVLRTGQSTLGPGQSSSRAWDGERDNGAGLALSPSSLVFRSSGTAMVKRVSEAPAGIPEPIPQLQSHLLYPVRFFLLSSSSSSNVAVLRAFLPSLDLTMYFHPPSPPAIPSSSGQRQT
ncbi:hypothetical protein C8F01DRAFT_639588 [Mycena amicta]|nr:hypothetical protein C8F01DRAFT_639588 [Mycena amicta]